MWALTLALASASASTGGRRAATPCVRAQQRFEGHHAGRGHDGSHATYAVRRHRGGW